MSAVAPTLLAIVLAIATRQVHLSLLLGLVLGESLLAGGIGPGMTGTLDRVLAVFADPGNASVVLFCVLIGGFLALVEASGGVAGFVRAASRFSALETRRGTELFAIVIGCVIFIESSITALVTGTVSRPLFDRQGISREKLAYYCDSTSAPICLLIPVNAWGAFLLGLLAETEDPVRLLARSIPLAFYPIAAIAMVFLTAALGLELGPMRRCAARTPSEGAPEEASGRARRLLVPLFGMVVLVPVSLLVTGEGDFFAGSGSRAVLAGVLGGSALAALFYVADAKRPLTSVMPTYLRGAGALLPLGALMTLAIAFGALSKDLGTGPTLAAWVTSALDARLSVAALFVTASLIAFATGTSWGTFALTIPLALPLAEATGLPAPLMVGAAISGGVFGDHTSPISDTTVVSALAAGCDPIDHVRTQLPYALIAGGVAAAGFVVAAALMS
jgi:tetracycline resistance efflux pump